MAIDLTPAEQEEVLAENRALREQYARLTAEMSLADLRTAAPSKAIGIALLIINLILIGFPIFEVLRTEQRDWNEINWVVVVVGLLVFNAFAIPAFVFAVIMESRQGRLGGWEEIAPMVLFALSLLVAVGVFLPYWAKAWVPSVYKDDQLLPRPRLTVTPIVPIQTNPDGTAATDPEGKPIPLPMEVVKAIIPPKEANDDDIEATLAVIQLFVTPNELETNGVIVDPDYEKLHVWYIQGEEGSERNSFADGKEKTP